MNVLGVLAALLTAALVGGGSLHATAESGYGDSRSSSNVGPVLILHPPRVEVVAPRYEALLGQTQSDLMRWLKENRLADNARIFGCSYAAPLLMSATIGFEICDGRVAWVWQSTNDGVTGSGKAVKSISEKAFEQPQSAFSFWAMP